MDNFTNDVFDPQLQFKIEEASNSEVDGKHVLGKLSGTFFVPNGKSRNKRWYSDTVWEKQLGRKDIQEKLQGRRMLGTISHEQKLDDQAILEGKVSHVMTKLEVRNTDKGKQGYGEALILDTPAGKILNTLSRAGVQLHTSSRATGKFKGTHEGLPSVDPDEFNLSGFDFVLDAGFLEAKPALVENLKESMDKLLDMSINDSNNNGRKEGDDDMGDKNNSELLESALKENGKMQSDLTAALNENEDLKSKNVELSEQVVVLDETKKKLEEAEKALEAFKPLGTAEEIDEALELAKKEREAFKDLGTAEEIEEALDMGKELIEQYIPLGTPEEIDEALDLTKKIKEEYKDLGTPEEISEAFDLTKKFMEEKNAEKDNKKITELAEEFGVTEDAIREIYAGDEEKVRNFFKDLNESKKYRNKFRKSDNSDDKKEENKKSSMFERTAGQNLMESLS